jgi:HD-like signal output (HDOD) protein
LKDAGLLVLVSRLPDLFRKMLDEARASGRSLFEVEAEVLGITHPQIGAYLLGIWGLPYSIVEAVAHHHAPRSTGAQQWDVLGAVHVASGVSSEMMTARGASKPITATALDLDYLQELGLADELPHWRSLANADDVSLRL